MRYVNDEASRRLYAEFLVRRGQRDIRPAAAWARGGPCWKNEIILAEDQDGGIIGGMSVLIRRVPFFGVVMVSPLGPVCAADDADALRQLIEGAELLAWKYNAMVLRMEPDVPGSDRRFRTILEDLGCRVREDAGARPQSIGEVSAVYRPGIYRLYRLGEQVRRSRSRAERSAGRREADSPAGPLPLTTAGGAGERGSMSA